jgi:hypothetical protein
MKLFSLRFVKYSQYGKMAQIKVAHLTKHHVL